MPTVVPTASPKGVPGNCLRAISGQNVKEKACPPGEPDRPDRPCPKGHGSLLGQKLLEIVIPADEIVDEVKRQLDSTIYHKKRIDKEKAAEDLLPKLLLPCN